MPRLASLNSYDQETPKNRCLWPMDAPDLEFIQQETRSAILRETLPSPNITAAFAGLWRHARKVSTQDFLSTMRIRLASSGGTSVQRVSDKLLAS
jgi:hypothetical protein